MHDRALVILPTYNEAENIAAIIERVLEQPINADVLVVDDRSPDGTASIVSLLQKSRERVHLIERCGRAGLGRSYVEGFLWAIEKGYPIVIQMDADFSHDPQYLPHMVDLIKTKQADVVVGSRYVAGGGADKSWGLARKVLSRFGNWYARVVTQQRVADVTAGFKCFSGHVLSGIGLETVWSNGYAFQIEISKRCSRNKFRIIEVPIVFHNRRAGATKLSIKIIWEAVWKIWLLR